MNTKVVLNLFFAAILFLAAYWTFDWYNWTSIGLASVLTLSGIHLLFMDSESKARRDLARSCQRVALFVTVFLLVKLLIFG